MRCERFPVRYARVSVAVLEASEECYAATTLSIAGAAVAGFKGAGGNQI